MVVKNILLPAILVFGLVGCTSITTMTPAQFNQLAATQIPFAGSWAGEVGPSSAVLQLSRQGHGIFCIDDGKDVMSYNVKLIDQVLYSDKGVKFKVKELNNSNAKIHMSLLGLGVTFDLNKDDQLQRVTSACKQALN
ncbi:hypothetical protein NDN11_13595 [Acinetobacter sp. C26M]|uniref:J517_1871 family lipoprotein n=1 Tax=unclassified Acinetobacter TaxID=196816 RepID=UPI002036C1C5|nr:MULTISPECIES: J517_1871 family lipoprotein [unclassified Acinetobacter]USA48336.1 hypothetical protein NDN11_13595 [Acinetobacter sp. C26M]USA51825.1 hypothetical protein NDN12_13595 [Acinetobacter sp. C26G]